MNIDSKENLKSLFTICGKLKKIVYGKNSNINCFSSDEGIIDYEILNDRHGGQLSIDLEKEKYIFTTWFNNRDGNKHNIEEKELSIEKTIEILSPIKNYLNKLAIETLKRVVEARNYRKTVRLPAENEVYKLINDDEELNKFDYLTEIKQSYD